MREENLKQLEFELEFNVLFHGTYEAVRKYISRFGLSKMDAEDVAQETLCTVFFKMGTLRDEDKFEPWLKKVAQNTALQCIRKNNRDMLMGDDIMEIVDAQQLGNMLGLPDEFDGLQQEELVRDIKRELQRLDEKCSQLMNLYYYKGYSLQQAAELLNLNYNTAKTLHSRALKKLKPVMIGIVKDDGRWKE